MAKKPKPAQEETINELRSVLPDGCRLVAFDPYKEPGTRGSWLLRRIVENETGDRKSNSYRIEADGTIKEI